MKRRSALKLTATILGGTIFGSEFFLSGCNPGTSGAAMFSELDIVLLDEIGETILPETEDSPGAKAARIGLFMSEIVTDCYSQDEQSIFIDGLETIKSRAHEVFDTDFDRLSAPQRLKFLDRFENEAKVLPEGQPHFFKMMKQLTVWGYFSSEPGATKALRYNPVPGRYIGCYPYEDGDKAWAE